jgi:hypothetical protein
MKPLTITRGRFVHYHCGESDDLLNPGPDGLLSAFVSFVNPDGSVNVTVHAADGSTFARSGVAFFDIGKTLPESGRYCVWPEAIVRMEEAAKVYEGALAQRGVTLEQAAAGQLSAAGGPPQDIQGPAANDAVKTSSDETVHDTTPVHREPVNLEQADPGNAEPAATDATLDAAQKSDATESEDPALNAADSGA